MRCRYATATDEFYGRECQITGGECSLLSPNELLCPGMTDSQNEAASSHCHTGR